MKHETGTPRPRAAAPWVIDTRELGRRAGQMLPYRRTLPAPDELGMPDVIAVPEGSDVDADLRLESVVEGVLVSGTVSAPLTGQCARCLDSVSDRIEVSLTELYAYPDSTTDSSTDGDEVGRIVDDMIDLAPAVRDAVVLALPQVPLCREDCPGLCPECGTKRADLEPDHRHETIDPRWAALQQRFGPDGFGAAEEENE